MPLGMRHAVKTASVKLLQVMPWLRPSLKVLEQVGFFGEISLGCSPGVSIFFKYPPKKIGS